MKYWAFEMKTGDDKLINCNEIERVFLLGKHQEYDVMSGIGVDVIYDNVQLLKTEIVSTVNPKENKNFKSNRKKKDSKIPVRHEIRAGGKTEIVHIPVSAEQRFQNKKVRESVEGTIVKILSDGINTDFFVKRHVDGSLYLLQEENTHHEYWGKWKIQPNEWVLWSDNYVKKGKKGTPHEHHRSACCYAPNRRRLANKPFCLDCAGDTKVQRTNRRINNGGPESNLIFTKDGELTTAWTQQSLDRLRQQEDNE
mgnify:FL=1|tara:strand:- start:2180 stop:2938 length:759 start_codon:yes stop_codon:yes gene_type:complete